MPAATPDRLQPDLLQDERQVIRIRGARMHNLQNIDIDLPRNRLVVLTGLSGSGKSSLAFDTLLAEGQRQYIDSMSIYTRQFFDQMERPDVDLIEGLQPTVAIDQCRTNHNPRSTVATVTEIYDFLRVLMARVAEVNCPDCLTPISQQTPTEIQKTIALLPDKTKVMILAPLVRGRKGKHADVLQRVVQDGFIRVRIDGETYELEHVPELKAGKRHDIEAVVDRVIIRPNLENRLAESVRLALKHGDGALRIVYLNPGATEAIPSGKDSEGKGTGATPGAGSRQQNGGIMIGADGWHEQIFNTRYACPDCKRSLTEVEPRTFSFNSPYGACRACDGLGTVGEEEDVVLCDECGGSRLQIEGRACRLGGLAIQQITALSLAEAADFFSRLNLPPRLEPIGAPLIGEIIRRLRFLIRVGVDYLSLDRGADSLSGGEMQRVRLATGIGSGMVGVLYILDEPSIGLHPRDHGRLIESFRHLQQQGNTVLVVEHDQQIMRQCDWLIDMGPGAGAKGGSIVAQGTPDQVAACQRSITGGYLSGRLRIEAPTQRRRPVQSRMLYLQGATANNLQQVDLALPLGLLTCVTGVSGSGKSSLVIDTLARAVARKLTGSGPHPGPYQALRGVGKINRVIHVDQTPIGRNPRSNPATYTGLFDEIRRLFAKTKQARQLGYRLGRFSFNTKGGRCEHCKGQGVERIEMRFLPDLFVTCPVCHGRQFNRQTLAIRYHDKSIADVLAMSIEAALAFFENHPNAYRMLKSLNDIGLGYMTLGQRCTTLSGGEAQRVRLATELGRTNSEQTLTILDEPTTGLHADDIGRLLAILQQLVERGNTVLVIEHNMDVIQAADWVIDMGPEGGDGGGRMVATGPPEEIAQCRESHTGAFLRPVLGP
jgi:excinuclease ABC subunit A